MSTRALTSLSLANGTTETRTITSRYFPESIQLGAPLSRTWLHQTDPVGNHTRIDMMLDCPGNLLLSSQTISTPRASCMTPSATSSRSPAAPDG